MRIYEQKLNEIHRQKSLVSCPIIHYHTSDENRENIVRLGCSFHVEFSSQSLRRTMSHNISSKLLLITYFSQII